MNKFDVSWAVEEWFELVEAQKEAPDYPYEGQSYSGTWGAADGRWQWWHELEEFHGKEFADAVRDEVYGPAED